MDKVFVAIIGLFGIIFTFWFFLMRKEKEIVAKTEINITVSGGYSPEVISIPLGKTTKINFTRIDPTDCLSEVVLPDFRIKRELPLNKKVTVEITPEKSGEFKFACSMNMYHGKIIVK